MAQVRAYRLPVPETEVAFADDAFGRKWRLDVYWRPYRLGVELHGLILIPGKGGSVIVRGGHATIDGLHGDANKRNAAILLGIDVLTFYRKHVDNKDAIKMTMRALTVKGWNGEHTANDPGDQAIPGG